MQKIKNSRVVPFKKDGDLFYRIGVRYANKRSFESAKKYLEKAVKEDPFSAEYQFNYACVLAELKESKKSNSILLNILKNIDPTMTDCYFGIGCNHFDMENLKKAKEYFEKYIYFAPTGQFVEEAQDIIYYLQIYENVGPSKNTDKLLLKVAQEGKEMIQKGQFSKACEKLEKALEIDPEAVSVRNDLSVALFCEGDESRGISMAKSVLKLEPQNVTANCNLLLFYATLNKIKAYHQQQKVVSKLEANNKEHFIKILDTFIKLEDHYNIIRFMVNYLKENHEPIFYHLIAIGFYNLKKYENSKEIWETMHSGYPQYNLITGYFLNLIQSTMEGTAGKEYLEYNTKLPQEQNQEVEDVFNELKVMPGETIKQRWIQNKTERDILNFYLYEGSIENKKRIIDLFAAAKDKDLDQALMIMLDQTYVQKEVKQYIRNALGLKEENFPEVRPERGNLRVISGRESRLGPWKKEWDAVIECALMRKESNYQPGYRKELKHIWLKLMEKQDKNPPMIKKSELWAAVIEYLYCDKYYIRVSKKNLAKKYNITTNALISKLKEYEK